MGIESKDFLTKFEEFKKKYGWTYKFKQFKKKYGFDIEFIKFKKKNGIKHSKKNGWNKQFSPIVKQVWVKDKKQWNKGLRKHGYYKNLTTGWKLGGWVDKKCLWCGLLLTGKQTKFCSIEPKERHKKLFSKVVSIGKKRYGFDLNKQNHILIKPKLFDYTVSPSGQLIKIRTKKERIEFKDIEFIINGERHRLTAKSRTIKKYVS